MTAYRQRFHRPAHGLALALVAAAVVCITVPAWAQSSNLKQQVRTDQVRHQLRSGSLREQQRQQTSSNTRKAFQQSSRAQQGIDRSDDASRDRYRSQQRDRVQDYVHREQAASTAHSDSTSATSQPAHASSSR